MAITKQSAVVTPYRRSAPPQKSEKTFLYADDELKKIQHTLDRIIMFLPTVADAEPEVKYVPMIRYATSPWDPMGTGDGYVWWDGSSWNSL